MITVYENNILAWLCLAESSSQQFRGGLMRGGSDTISWQGLPSPSQWIIRWLVRPAVPHTDIISFHEDNQAYWTNKKSNSNISISRTILYIFDSNFQRETPVFSLKIKFNHPKIAYQNDDSKSNIPYWIFANVVEFLSCNNILLIEMK